MKKIICATDYSDNSVSALKYSYAISKLLKADVIVLHVFKENSKTETNLISEVKQNILHHKNRIRDFRSLHLKRKFNSLNFSEVAVSGSDVGKEIVRFASGIKVSMIVMGACGYGNVKEFFMGSTSKKTIEISPVPVLIIPSNFVFRGLEKVLYCSDLQLKDIYNIGKLVKIVTPVNSKIIIVHIAEKDDVMNKNLLEWFQNLLKEKVNYAKLEIQSIFSDDIFESLQNFIDQSESDMVVMMERKHKPEINYVLHRDLVKRMQSSIKLPLLSFNETS